MIERDGPQVRIVRLREQSMLITRGAGWLETGQSDDYRRRINPTMPTIIQTRPAAISK
jgi:hypothetical protein